MDHVVFAFNYSIVYGNVHYVTLLEAKKLLLIFLVDSSNIMTSTLPSDDQVVEDHEDWLVLWRIDAVLSKPL